MNASAIYIYIYTHIYIIQTLEKKAAVPNQGNVNIIRTIEHRKLREFRVPHQGWALGPGLLVLP